MPAIERSADRAGMDLNGFKQVNDRFGRSREQSAAHVCDGLKESCREYDMRPELAVMNS